MALPHYRNAKAATANWEPIYLDLFEVNLTPPAGITLGNGNANQPLFLEHVKKISGLEVDKNPGTVEQHYKFAKRRYASSRPESTVLDLTIDFEVNLNDSNSMYIFKTLRAWSDLVYNPLTGSMALKRDYTGSASVSIFNRQGDITRRVDLPTIWPTSPINAMELDYTSNELWSLSITFASDVWNDVFV
jgi:hypothetical protein